MPYMTETGQLTTADLAKTASSEHEEARKPETGDTNSGPLLQPAAAEELRGRWETIQTGFVDEPRRAVLQADELVASAIQRVAETFAEERAKLEQQWSRGDDVSTEDL